MTQFTDTYMNHPAPVTWIWYRNQLLYIKTTLSGYICMKSAKMKFTIMIIRLWYEENHVFAYFPISSEAHYLLIQCICYQTILAEGALTTWPPYNSCMSGAHLGPHQP